MTKDPSIREMAVKPQPAPPPAAPKEESKAADPAPEPKPIETAAPEPVKKEPTKVEEPRKSIIAEKLTKKEPIKEQAKEPVKDEPKAAEPAPEDKLEPDAKASEQSKNGFKELKTIAKTLREQLAAKDKEIQEYKEKTEKVPVAEVAIEEVEKYRKQAEELSAKLAAYDLKAHPTYQQQYELPKQQALRAAQELIEANGITDVNLERLIDVPRSELGKTISKVTDALPRFDAAEVEANIREAYKVMQAEKHALANSSATMENMRKQHVAQQIQAFADTYGSLESSITEFSPELEIPKDADENVRNTIIAYNESRSSLKKAAEQRAFGIANERHAAELAIKSAAYDHTHKFVLPMIAQELDTAIRERNQYWQELQAIKAQKPNKSITATPSNTTPAKSGRPLSWSEHVAQST